MTLIAPGSTLGVFGGGQLGRFFTIAAKHLGYKVAVYCPEANSPALQIADYKHAFPYEDESKVKAFLDSVSLCTYEFENIPHAAYSLAKSMDKSFPSAKALEIAQDRSKEKEFLSTKGFPGVRFWGFKDLDSLLAGSSSLEYPCIIKTAQFGYDGKGQWEVGNKNELSILSPQDSSQPLIVEKKVSLEKEFSIIVARAASSKPVVIGPIENGHQNHILDLSFFPSRIDPASRKQAEEIALSIAEELNYLGVLSVEFFLSSEGEVMVNELAPRPHNSGHLTLDSFVCSQFEQQVRAICNLPLGAADSISPAAMVNLLGDLWLKGEPNWGELEKFPAAKLYLYGKEKARSGRKMGHITCLGSRVEAAIKMAKEARFSLFG